MPGIHITDVESAINYWREREPSPDGVTLAAPIRALAEVKLFSVTSANAARVASSWVKACTVWTDDSASDADAYVKRLEGLGLFALFFRDL